MESRARRLFSERCHRNYLCVYRRKRASRHAASSVTVGAGGHRHYIYFDGFYFQNLCPAFGCYGADGNYLCGVFFTPEISPWLAGRHGGDRGGHFTWLVTGYNDGENLELDLCFGHAGLCRWSALGGALRSGISELFLGHFSNGGF